MAAENTPLVCCKFFDGDGDGKIIGIAFVHCIPDVVSAARECWRLRINPGTWLDAAECVFDVPDEYKNRLLGRKEFEALKGLIKKPSAASAPSAVKGVQ